MRQPRVDRDGNVIDSDEDAPSPAAAQMMYGAAGVQVTPASLRQAPYVTSTAGGPGGVGGPNISRELETQFDQQYQDRFDPIPSLQDPGVAYQQGVPMYQQPMYVKYPPAEPIQQAPIYSKSPVHYAAVPPGQQPVGVPVAPVIAPMMVPAMAPVTLQRGPSPPPLPEPTPAPKSDITDRDVKLWSKDEVSMWVAHVIEERFANADLVAHIVSNFQTHSIDGQALHDLEDSDWPYLVPEVAARRCLMNARNHLMGNPKDKQGRPRMLYLMEVTTVFLLLIAFIAGVVATSYAGWVQRENPIPIKAGLWKHCTCDISDNTLCQCASLGDTFYGGYCAGTLRTMRAFSVMGIVFCGLAFLVSLYAARKSLGVCWRTLAFRLCLFAAASTLVCWAVTTSFRQCLPDGSDAWSYDASFGLEVGSFGLAFFAVLTAAYTRCLVRCEGTCAPSCKKETCCVESGAAGSEEAINASAVARVFKWIVFGLVTIAFVVAIIATAHPAWMTAPYTTDQGTAYNAQIGLWRKCDCVKDTVTPACECHFIGDDFGSGVCPDRFRTVRAFSLLGVFYLGFAFLISLKDLWCKVTRGWRIANIWFLFLAWACTLICWAVFTDYRTCQPGGRAHWGYDACFGLEVGAFGLSFFAWIAAFLLHRIKSMEVPAGGAAAAPNAQPDALAPKTESYGFKFVKWWSLMLLFVGFVCAVIATAYPGWVAKKGSNGTINWFSLGLWRLCYYRETFGNGLNLVDCDSFGDYFSDSTCVNRFRVVRAFSILGIVLLGIAGLFAAYDIFVATISRFWRGVNIWNTFLAMSCTLICWAVFTAIPDSCLAGGNSDWGYNASFGLQIGSFGMAFFAWFFVTFGFCQSMPRWSEVPAPTAAGGQPTAVIIDPATQQPIMVPASQAPTVVSTSATPAPSAFSPRPFRMARAIARMTVFFTGLVFAVTIIASAIPNWAKRTDDDGNDSMIGLWRVCQCFPTTSKYPVCKCYGVIDLFKDETCNFNNLFSTVRAFSLLSIIFAGLAFITSSAGTFATIKKCVHSITGASDKHWKLITAWLTGFDAAFCLVCWAVFTTIKECEGAWHYDASFGLEIAAFSVAVFAAICAQIEYRFSRRN